MPDRAVRSARTAPSGYLQLSSLPLRISMAISPKKSAMPNITVMLVDDSVAVRDRLSECLREVPGLEIVGMAGDENKAVLLYDRCQPDAAVLDIRLRHGSGIVVLEHIKRRERHCLVIVLTNCVHAEFRRRCEQAGADYFFEKFREFDQVAGVFRNLLRQRLPKKE